MKKLSLLLIAGSFLVLACNNSGKNKAGDTDTTAVDSGALTHEDSEFVNKAAMGGMMEIELGKLAEKQALNDRVKNFGAMMVKDHTRAGEELKALASQRNWTLPASVTEKHREDIEKMKKKKGVDFDKSYMKMMLSDHRHDISDFKKVAEKSSDADLKAYAAKTLPVLKVHLDSAKSINREVKASVDPGDITSGMEVHPLK